jgi:peptide/nickel transport system substrate-binding protein
MGAAAIPTFDPLIAVDDHGRYRPDLALKWTFSHGGRWIILDLRHGVRFNNGHPFNAKVLKAQFDYLLKQPAGLAPLQRVQVVGPYTVRLVYSSPFRPALQALTGFGAVDVPAQLALGDKACMNSIGTGAFKIASVAPGFNSVTLVRNPFHTWGSPWLHNRGKSYLSSITIKTLVDDTQATSALLSGDLDISRVAPAQLPRLQGQPGIVLHRFPDANELFMGFNHAHAPFNNPAVRRAIAEAIDRKGLIKAAYGGLGTVQTSIVPQADPAHDSAAGKYLPKYDPSAAARVLKAHHVTGPYTLETYTIPVFADTAQYIQAELANVGVKVNLAVKGVGDAQADMGRGLMDMYVDIRFGSDLYSVFHSSQTPQTGAHNWNFMHDTQLDRLIVQSRETVAPKKARPILNALQQYMNRQSIVLPLFSRELIGATRTRVQGYRYVPGSNTLMWPAFEELHVK